ncbi:hypothetical protein [Labilibaculum antarcticum]|uniref:Uncharacterized protein n=1 Tax=Labilibaculum antarcticum TaxID=1717717 RepID=A0A1Y1CPL1_9BACT|nr:hypothetical protein [Labilibaculum antarcticum]BAX82378.1 hypothetical protein ALGA_4087 [Labilibaculum antarcticum]
MKKSKLAGILFVLFLLFQSAGIVSGRAVAIKKWKGRYPQMKNDYPLTFIAFKGWLPPVPHLFIKTPLTHYYWKVKSMPVTDSEELEGKTKTGLMRLAAKLMERFQFKGRYQETNWIKILNAGQKEIGQKLFDSRSDQLEDLYGLTETFIALYENLDRLDHLEKGGEVKKVLKKEANEMLEQFLMVNFLESEQGEKLQAFTDLKMAVHKFSGELDYTYNKLKYFNLFTTQHSSSYAFLTQ